MSSTITIDGNVVAAPSPAEGVHDRSELGRVRPDCDQTRFLPTFKKPMSHSTTSPATQRSWISARPPWTGGWQS